METSSHFSLLGGKSFCKEQECFKQSCHLTLMPTEVGRKLNEGHETRIHTQWELCGYFSLSDTDSSFVLSLAHIGGLRKGLLCCLDVMQAW